MNAETKEAFNGFRINGCSPLNSTGIDALHQILPMIYGIATLLEMGFRKETNGEAVLDAANPELVAAAFDGIAYLSALAMFQAGDL